MGEVDTDIAIVGMAAHLPGADTITAFWENLRAGRSAIRRLDAEALLAAGESPERMRQPNYVPVAAPLDGFDRFDAEFFGLSPKEAAIMDPQHRQFLEVAWEALENAGHPPENFTGPVAVFAGCGMGSYFYFNICSNPDLVASTGMFLLRHTGNDKDFLATRVSHVFDLRGPSVNIQTACSTSLVAVHYACQSLLNGECDMALAGGVTIELPQGRGYEFAEGEILSPDGECHAFDHRARGTVFGSGAGAVVLRRLADALADGDHIWAVIKGSAVNNDGAAKAGYLAPSVDGQARAIAEAQAVAGARADSIDYVECHGTGTFLGDPIEVAALTAAFRKTTTAVGTCRLGSVKTNIGHLDTAAGVAGLIKTALALHHRQIPASLGFEAPNPAIDFSASPFVVNAGLTDWPVRRGPRRAGVNALGAGGTNAHLVLQEAPPRPASPDSDWPFQLLVLSGRSRAALDANARALADHLRAHPDLALADVAFTLKEGRRAFDRRRVLVAQTPTGAADLLDAADPRLVFNHTALAAPEVVFMFPGGGAQYPGMARDLYETEPVFHDWMERGLAILQPKLDYDLRAIWLPAPGGQEAAAGRMKRPSVQLPLIMIVEYALAQLWLSWGVRPSALVGHSMGENTAACLAGVMSFADCIGLVHLRGQLFDSIAPGGMLSVPLALAELEPLLGEDLDVASVNAPNLTVVSGPDAALDRLALQLAARQIDGQRIAIDIAAHSRMLAPILARFGDYLRGIALHPPKIPFVSNRSGDFITDAEATDPDYWVAHLRGTVRFADCITTLATNPNRIYLEVGPGRALASLTAAHGAVPGQQVVSSLRHPDQPIADDACFIGALGRLWALGLPIDWTPIWGEVPRQRLPLPGYAFQRSRYFIAPGTTAPAAPATTAPPPARLADMAQWGWRPVWRPRLADVAVDADGRLDPVAAQRWLIFVDAAGLGARLAARLRTAGHPVTEVRPGDSFSRTPDGNYLLAPEQGRESYALLIADLVARGLAPDRIAHCWLVTADETCRPGSSFFHRNLEQGFQSLMGLAQAIGEAGLPMPLHLSVITTGAAQVGAEPLPYPEKATALGPVRVTPHELPGVTCALLDVALPNPHRRFGRARPDRAALDQLADRVMLDLLATPANTIAARRGERRLALGFEPTALPPADPTVADHIALRDGGVCLITGGFGGIGLTLAERLITQSRARIVLLGRSPLPARDDWTEWLRQHGPHDGAARRITAVQRLEAIGGQVMAAAADVCNIEDMRRVLAEVGARFGAVNMVIHAAGVTFDAPLLTKSPASVEAVFAPKIHGTRVLEALFPDGALDTLVLCSSTSTVTAPAGQIDYVAANEYLNAIAKSRSGGKTRVIAINWGIWAGVGMAAEALAARHGDQPPTPPQPLPIPQPLLDTAGSDAAGNRLFHRRLSTDHWLLDQHRTLAGAAILPGTGYLELIAEAARAAGAASATGGFEIRDLYFLRPLQVPDAVPCDLRLRLVRHPAGTSVTVQSGVTRDGRHGYQLHVEAALLPDPGPRPAPLDLAAIAARCPRQVGTGDLRSPQEAHLRFGPRWRVLQSMAYGAGEGLARLALPEGFRSDLTTGILLHPALLDLATGWAMELIAGYRPTHLWVPASFARIRVFGPLPAVVASHVRAAADNHAAAPYARFDITVCDAAGDVCVEIEGFSIRRLDGDLTAAQSSPSEIEFDPPPATTRPTSAAGDRLARNMSQGITPAEGAQAFGRALASGWPQLVISSLDLPALIREADTAPPAAAAAASVAASIGGGPQFDRPALEGAYVAPSSEIETRLAGLWSDLLGIGKVGATDSFFDLGGHSLIAVRLFAQIKKAFAIEFPISVLFEAPTIARLAAMIAARIGGTTAAPDAAAAPAPMRPRFTHLVAMDHGPAQPKTPFFLVAGMFGNVLNLRHLAQLLGADRPFWGVQARGLLGDVAPHFRLPAAAADAIAELREVQPHGPYLLGGFSGGGITALEMARQLAAAGEKVALLVLLDTPLPVRPNLTRTDRLLIKAQELRRKGPGYLGEWAIRRIGWELSRHRAAPADKPGPQFHNAAIEAAFRAAVAAYDLQPWPGATVLARPPLDRRFQVGGGRWVSAAREYVFADNDWGRHIAKLEVIEVPGDHDSMVLEPAVRVLAARLKAALAAAEAAAQDDRPAGVTPWPGAEAAE